MSSSQKGFGRDKLCKTSQQSTETVETLKITSHDDKIANNTVQLHEFCTFCISTCVDELN